MAEEDDASKTEDPTEKKLGCKKKGEVSKSVEINSWFILVGGAVSLIVFTLYSTKYQLKIRFLITTPHSIPIDLGHLLKLFSSILFDLGLILAPIFVALIILGIFSNTFQTGLIWATEKLQLDVKKFLLKGFKRLVSTRALVEF